MQTVKGIGTTLIGKKNRVELPRPESPNFEGMYYESHTYQAIKWFVILYLPVIPLGTYLVQDGRERSALGTYHLMKRIEWDWKQVMTHYLVWLVLVPIALIFWARLS